MTVDIDSAIVSVCLTWLATLFLFFLINWNNNSYEYYKVEEYLRATNCYSVTDNYNNALRVVSYCDKRSLTELLGDPNDR